MSRDRTQVGCQIGMIGGAMDGPPDLIAKRRIIRLQSLKKLELNHKAKAPLAVGMP